MNIDPADRKKLLKIMKNPIRNDNSRQTVQQSIPFERMFRDGICRVESNFYTKTICFQDINYQLAQHEDRKEIFAEWCSFLNFFDSSISFELSFMNFAADSEKFEQRIAISHRVDGFDEIRDEYTGMLIRQMASGNNGLSKAKYLTFGIHGESLHAVRPRLIHIEMDLLNNFKRLGVQAKTLDGKERLELIYQMFHMEDGQKFRFDWSMLASTGLTPKDFIAPPSLYFKSGKCFPVL